MNSLVFQRQSSRQILAISLMVLLAFGLRLVHLDSSGFWTDEGLTSLRASYSVPEILSNTITIQNGSGKDTHPPFYYLLIHFALNIWGKSDFAMRYLSLLAGVLLVPLLYQFGRRLAGQRLGGVVSLLTAINPLQIWYAQEARMYTVLVFLAACMSFVLWRVLVTNNWRRYGPLYLLLASLTIYTHYTAVFLIAVQALFGAWLLWRNGQRRLLLGTAVLLLFVAAPLIPATIPRLFSGAEPAYFSIPPAVILQDIVRNFSLGVTVDFSQPFIRLLVVAIVVLMLIGFAALSTWSKRLFLLAYLLAVPIGLIAGSLIKPMYLGVRHIMIGSPALLLVVARGFLWLVSAAGRDQFRHQKVIWGGTAVLAAGVLFIGPTIALNNLYNNHYYGKDNFRDLIQYIEEKAGQNDIIVYNDAILLAVHEHYQQRTDLPVTAVPEYPISAQLSIDTMPILAAAYERIWFLPDPPDDGRDAEHLIQTWLDDHLQIVDRYDTSAQSALVQVMAYATSPLQMADVPANGRSLDIQWPDLPALQGVQLQFDQPATLSTLWFDLFWQGGTAPDPAVQLRFSLRGADGQDWVISEQPLAATAVPWPSNQFVRQHYSLSIPPGTPPGRYTLFIQPSAGVEQPLTEIDLAASTRWPQAVQRPFNAPALTFQYGLTLIDALHDDKVRPGHVLPLTLYWQAEEPLGSGKSHFELQVIAPDGSQFKQLAGSPAPAWLETWPVGSPIVAYTGLYFPPDTEPGRYRLRWQLFVGDNSVGVRPYWRSWYRDQIDFGTVTVIPWPLETTLPEDAAVMQAQFGPDIALYGYKVNQTDNSLNVTLFWQAAAPPNESYFSFLHLVDTAGTIVTQAGFVPVSGLRPTKGWRAGEILADTYSLTLPYNLTSGQYQLIAGLFNPDTGARPSVIYQGQPQAENQLLLTTLTLP